MKYKLKPKTVEAVLLSENFEEFPQWAKDAFDCGRLIMLRVGSPEFYFSYGDDSKDTDACTNIRIAKVGEYLIKNGDLFSHMTATEFEEMYEVIPEINPNFKNNLYSAIMSETLETGMFSRAYHIFKDVRKDHPKEADLVLVALIKENISNPHLLEGVLHILQDLDFKNEFVVILFYLTKRYKSLETETVLKLIGVCESWHNRPALFTVKRLSFTDSYNEDYRLQVIEDIKEYMNV